MTTEAPLLDIAVRDVFADRGLLHRVVRAIQLDRPGTSYISAVEQLHKGVEYVHDAHKPAILRYALEGIGGRIDPHSIADVVKLLERRDDVVGRLQACAAARYAPRVDVDAHGRVLISPEEAGAALAQDQREARFQRAFRLDGRYQTPQGRVVFEHEDRINLSAGRDIVRTLEHHRDLGEAQRAVELEIMPAVRTLDDAIEAAGVDRRELLTLEQRIAGLADPSAVPSLEATRSELRAKAELTSKGAVKLLDTLEAGTGSQEHLVKSLDAVRRETAGPVSPPGVHPDSHALHVRIRERMAADSAPEGDYLKYAKQLDQALEGW